MTTTTCDHTGREATTYSSSLSESHEDQKLPAQLELYHKESARGKLNNDIDNFEKSTRKVEQKEHFPAEGRDEEQTDVSTTKRTVKGHADATDKKFQPDDPFSWTTDYSGNNTDELVVGHKITMHRDYTQPVSEWITSGFDSTWDQTAKLTTTLDTKQRIRHSTADGDTIDASHPAKAHAKREIEHTVDYGSIYTYEDKRHMILEPDPKPTNWQAPPDAVAGDDGQFQKWVITLHDRDDFAKQVDDDEYTFYIDLSTGQLRPTGGTSKHTVEIKESNKMTGWGEVQRQEDVALSQVVPIPGAELYWTYPAIVAHRTPGASPDVIENVYKYNYTEDSTFNPSPSSGSGGAFGAPIEPMADKSGDYTKSQSRTIASDTLADQKRILETGNPRVDFGPRFVPYTPSAQTSRVGDAFTQTGKHEHGAGTSITTVDGVTGPPSPYAVGGGETLKLPSLQSLRLDSSAALNVQDYTPSNAIPLLPPDFGEKLFGEEWTWPWSDDAAGFWDTVWAWGRALGTATAGAAAGAAGGAATGWGTGVVIGAGVGVLAGPGGAGLLGAGFGGAGATIGAGVGAIVGLIDAARSNGPVDAAKSGAIDGAIAGPTAVAVEVVAIPVAVELTGAANAIKLTAPRATEVCPAPRSNAVIGKLDDLTELRAGENTLLKHLPDQGSPKLNWEQNSSVLRTEMGKGLPIRDGSVNAATGALERNTGFLRAERELLRNHGWTYDPGSQLWNPPR